MEDVTFVYAPPETPEQCDAIIARAQEELPDGDQKSRITRIINRLRNRLIHDASIAE